MIVCGIDPSLTRTSVCLGDEHGTFAMESFRSQNQGNAPLDHVDRAEDLVSRVHGWLDEKLAGAKCQALAIEGYAHGMNPGTTCQLAEYGGILRWHLKDFVSANRDLYNVPPMSLKAFCGAYVGMKAGKGKLMVTTGITKTFGHVFQTDDEYDSFGLYRMAICLAGAELGRNAAQRSAIEKVLGMVPNRAEQPKRVERILAGELPF